MDNVVGRPLVDINPAKSKGILSSFSRHIFQEACGLEGGRGIDNLKDWLAAKVQNIDNNRVVKLLVIFESEAEPVRGLLIHLAVVAICQVLDYLSFDFVTCSLKNSN
jgi:hypothetical protein